MRMGLHQSSYITEIFNSFALSPLGIAPRFYFAFEGVLQRSNSEENAMHIGWHGSKETLNKGMFARMVSLTGLADEAAAKKRDRAPRSAGGSPRR